MNTLRSTASRLLLMHLAIAVSLGSCGHEEYQTPAEQRFVSMSDEERRTLDRLVEHIDAAEALLKDGRLTREQSDALQAAIDNARQSLDRYKRKRSQGHTRGVILMGLGSAGTGVVANDVTLLGVADDWMLVPLGIAAIVTYGFTQASASTTELKTAWNRVGDEMRVLGDTVSAIGQTLEQRAAQAGLKPRPIAPPAPTHRTTVDVSPPVPVPVPAPRERPDEPREECKPKPVCPHLGKDDWHNYCADTVLGNVFPGCDVWINGKAFDAKSGNTLYEVKTDDWDTYAEFLVNQTLDDHEAVARKDAPRAQACGYRYELIVGDAELAAALSKRLTPLDVVRHEPKCNRKAHKAGKSGVKAP